MRGTYFWHNFSLLALLKIFYYRLLYLSILAIKNSYKFYFAVILLHLINKMSLCTVACVEYIFVLFCLHL
jgi:hypothetical protein